MPTNRFYNLPEEKKCRIKMAILNELSKVSYDELSINKIIENAKIPRGSFYQYFLDKDDMLSYIMAEYNDKLKHQIDNSIVLYHGDLFEIFYNTALQVIVLGTTNDNIDVFKNILSNIRINKSYLLDGLLNPSIKSLLEDDYLSRLNLSNIKYTSKSELKNLIFLLINITRICIVNVFTDISKKEVLLEGYKQSLEFIKYGVIKDK